VTEGSSALLAFLRKSARRSRRIREETGQTPAKAIIERLRTEAARLMIESQHLPIETVARDAGFGDPDRMRRAFLRAYGQPPQVIRRANRIEARHAWSESSPRRDCSWQT